MSDVYEKVVSVLRGYDEVKHIGEIADEIIAALDEERKRCEDHTKVAIGKALRMGFKLGFMSTSEGFNGEYPFDGDDFESVERLVKLREQKLEGKEV